MSKKLSAYCTTTINPNTVPRIIQGAIEYRKKYRNSSNKSVLNKGQESKKKRMFADKEDLIDYYDQQLNSGITTEEFIQSLMRKAMQERNTADHLVPSLVSHLSSNRTVTQFTPYFDATLGVDNFYNDLLVIVTGVPQSKRM